MTETLLRFARELDRDPDELAELWSERAAIREHGQSRESAELGALEDLRAELGMARDRIGPKSAAPIMLVGRKVRE